MSDKNEYPDSCPLPTAPDLSKLTVVDLAPVERLPDYRAAIGLAGGIVNVLDICKNGDAFRHAAKIACPGKCTSCRA